VIIRKTDSWAARGRVEEQRRTLGCGAALTESGVTEIGDALTPSRSCGQNGLSAFSIVSCPQTPEPIIKAGMKAGDSSGVERTRHTRRELLSVLNPVVATALASPLGGGQHPHSTRAKGKQAKQMTQLDVSKINAANTRDSVGARSEGEAVVRAGLLLDRLKFSPGEISRSCDENLGKAIAFFQAVKMTRLSCHLFRPNGVRLWLSVIAYNLGNLRRRVLLKRIDNWSLTSLQRRLVKTGSRLVKHARYCCLLLAESHLTRPLFGSMVRRIELRSLPTG
jgi:Transposase DDE domain group 1